MRGETHFSKMTEMIWVLVGAYLNMHSKKKNKSKIAETEILFSAASVFFCVNIC